MYYMYFNCSQISMHQEAFKLVMKIIHGCISLFRNKVVKNITSNHLPLAMTLPNFLLILGTPPNRLQRQLRNVYNMWLGDIWLYLKWRTPQK